MSLYWYLNLFVSVNQARLIKCSFDIYLPKRAEEKRKPIHKYEIIQIQKNFNKFVIDKSVIDIFDFFKIKKFVKETSLEF